MLAFVEKFSNWTHPCHKMEQTRLIFTNTDGPDLLRQKTGMEWEIGECLTRFMSEALLWGGEIRKCFKYI